MVGSDEDRGPRIAAIDLIRGIAIGAMVVYHFSYDLSAERLIEADVVHELGWRILARLIAGTFLVLVGVNLVMANRRGLKPQPFLRRLILIVGAALLVTLATWWFEPGAFVFFGILHEIAAASVLALPFLWLPAWLAAAAAAVAIALPNLIASPIFDAPALWWVGLSTVPPVSVDYVPILPWFGVVLAGLVIGRLLVDYASDSAFARWRPTNAGTRFIILAGRWSLVIYLVHQPILVGAVHLVTPFLAPRETVARQDFMSDCVTVCRANGRDAGTCTAHCGCMFENLYGTDLFAATSVELMTPEQQRRWHAIVDKCVASAAMPPPAAE